LFKTAGSNSNNNDTSPRPLEADTRGKGGSPENLPNENTLCGGIVPVSSLEAAMGHHQQLSTSTSVLTTANSSNLDEMGAAAFEPQRYWTFPHNNYNSLLFAQPDWISSYHQQQQQNSLLQHPQLQPQQVNESLMSAGQMNGCAGGNPQFMHTFYGLPTTDASHNPMLFIQPVSFCYQTKHKYLIKFKFPNFRT
jgi:hypothetical protein